MDAHVRPSSSVIRTGTDCQNEHRGLGVSRIDFKVCEGREDGILILENVFHQKGGPPRHSHWNQDEWFYALEGVFAVEVGPDRFELGPGDSMLAPRGVPHVWAFIGENTGRMLISFKPAGKMEAFFRIVTRSDAMPGQDKSLWADHGMDLVGPPLNVL